MAPRGKSVDHRFRLPDDWIFLAQDHGYPQAAAGGLETLRAGQERSHHDDAGRLEDVTAQRRLKRGPSALRETRHDHARVSWKHACNRSQVLPRPLGRRIPAEEVLGARLRRLAGSDDPAEFSRTAPMMQFDCCVAVGAVEVQEQGCDPSTKRLLHFNERPVVFRLDTPARLFDNRLTSRITPDEFQIGYFEKRQTPKEVTVQRLS